MKNQSMKQEMLLIDKMDFDDSLTCEDLRVHYKTGQNMVSGSGRSRITKYRNGVQTNIGDIEVSVWRDLMRRFIVQLSENEIQEQLQHWAKKNCAWLRTMAEIEQEALELHAARIFDNPVWDGYIDFNKQYRPNVLESANLIWARYSCCGKVRQMTREQFEWEKSLYAGKAYCLVCKDYTSLVITNTPQEGDDQNG